jgi:hypothetical protein
MHRNLPDWALLQAPRAGATEESVLIYSTAKGIVPLAQEPMRHAAFKPTKEVHHARHTSC